MNVSHPELKELKACILRLTQQHQASVSDDNPCLAQFCRTLERIYSDGLSASLSFFAGAVDRHCWQWVAELSSAYTQKFPITLATIIEKVSQSKKVTTDRGRFRLFLRFALNKGQLAVASIMLRQCHLLKEYYKSRSVLRDEICSEIFISMLEPLTRCRFSLTTKNASFLDESWDLPLYRCYELVPSKSLGIRLEVFEGRMIVVEVAAGSVADEDGKIEPGDIVDELYTEVMRNVGKRRFSTVLSDYEGSPVYISIIKAVGKDGQLFRPILPYLEAVGLCKHKVLSDHLLKMREVIRNNSDLDSESQQSKLESGQYLVKLLGSVNVGSTGTVNKIETSVPEVLKNPSPLDVLFELGETGVSATCRLTGNAVLQHSYPEIASCGRRVDYPLNFSYIAGDTTCTISKHFFCFVFEAVDTHQSKAILQGIAQGFKRTHWAV